MAVEFGEAERNIKNLLHSGEEFEYENEKYTVIFSDKPTCHKGEPKTDIYVLAKDSKGKNKEFKISFKKKNADFIENKTNAERAELLFGKDWSLIIQKSLNSIHNAFENKKLIYKIKEGKTEEGAITLGWKFELMNKPSGKLSGKMELSKDQVVDVYAGTNLPDDKKNAIVNGEVIDNSGIANFMLVEDDIKSVQEIFDNIYTIDEYVNKHPVVYFACKALNYRSKKNKWDGNRPLAVYIDWQILDGKLYHEIHYDQPLIVKGNEVAKNLVDKLNSLGISDTDDINQNNVFDYNIVLE